MNILLVYPKFPDTFWSFNHILRIISKKAIFPPLGLLTVASLLPKNWNKKLVDLNAYELNDKDIKWADYVFISAMLVQQKSAEDIIKRCRQFNKKIVAGGPAFTTGYEKFKDIDYFVLNEAEITLPLFLQDLKKNKLKRIYTSNKRPDITKTPLPMWSLIKFKDYESMPVQYSRGCPFNCEFCDIIIMNGRVPRTKNSSQMVKEIETLYTMGWRGSVFIVDDNFIGNKINAKKMLRLLIEWQKAHKYPFKFLTEASTNLAEDNELMQLMNAANFNKVFLGIETPDENSLKECSKFQNIRIDLAECVKKIQHNGMQVQAGFIVGFDSDKENIFDRQIKFIQKVGIPTAMVGLLTILPQTRLWNRLKAEKRILVESTGENTSKSLNFIPKMGKEKLIRGYKKILASIYSPKEYYKRAFVFIKNYKPSIKSKVSFAEIKVLFRSMWEVGILSRQRFHYWGLLIKTFFTKIKAFPIAVELAITGFHLHKFAQQIVTAL